MAQAKAAEQDMIVKAQENQQDYEIARLKLVIDDRKVTLDERRLALDEMLALQTARSEALRSELDARAAEYEAQATAQ